MLGDDSGALRRKGPDHSHGVVGLTLGSSSDLDEWHGHWLAHDSSECTVIKVLEPNRSAELPKRPQGH